MLQAVESADSSDHGSTARHIGAFLADFLPEQRLQLLFSLASFLLFLGLSSPWARFPGGEFHPSRSMTVWKGALDQGQTLLVTFALVASIVLWVHATRRPLKRFLVWVVLPAACALVGFPLLLSLLVEPRDESRSVFAGLRLTSVHGIHSWLGASFYFTLCAVIVLCSALLLVRCGRISLPVRFRQGSRDREAMDRGAARDERDVFLLLIVVFIWGSVISMVTVARSTAALLEGKTFQPSSFSADERWIPLTVAAAVSAYVAVLLFRDQWGQKIRQFFRRQRISEYGIALAIPLAAVVVPPVVLRIISEAPAFKGQDWGYHWSALLPSPLPTILLVYVIALLEELALRGYLQGTLERHFSLRRSIFLTGLLWAVLPFWDMAQLPPRAILRVPGADGVAFVVGLIVYSVPLGWLYARTRSIVPVALMHGTIALFLRGRPLQALTHPELYWIELTLWIFIGWYLFRKHPLENASAT